MFLMYRLVIVGGRRDLIACGMRAKISFKAMRLPIPGTPCCTAAMWQGGGGSREDGWGDGTAVCCSLPWPVKLLTQQLESTNPGSRLSSDYILFYHLHNCYLFATPCKKISMLGMAR